MAVDLNGKTARNPQEQLAYNTKEIEKLKQIIKDTYKTTSELTDESVSDTRANTNVPENIVKGWLMTEDGLLFAITGNDGTTLLLMYYADLKGPQGETGASVSIDDNSTSNEKCWSSNKTKDYVDTLYGFACRKASTYFTSVEPTLNGTYYEIARTDLINYTGLNEEWYEGSDIIYLDSNNQPTKIYSIINYNSGTLQCSYRGTYTNVVANPTLDGTEAELQGITISGTNYKVGGSGDSKYKHTISIYNGGAYAFTLKLITDSNTSFITLTQVYNYLISNNLKNKSLDASGTYYDNGDKPIKFFKVGTNDGYSVLQFFDGWNDTPAKFWYGADSEVKADVVEPL